MLDSNHLDGPDRITRDAPALTVWTDHAGGSCRLDIRGQLCAETIEVLERHVDLLGCCQCPEVIMDLTNLESLDPTGAQVLVGLQHYVGGRGGRLRVIGGSAGVARLLREAASMDRPPPEGAAT